MPSEAKGNGSGKFNVHQTDMGGWVRIFTDPAAEVPPNLRQVGTCPFFWPD